MNYRFLAHLPMRTEPLELEYISSLIQIIRQIINFFRESL